MMQPPVRHHSPPGHHLRDQEPQKPGEEWKLLSSFLGRLADKYADQVHSIHIQFPDDE